MLPRLDICIGSWMLRDWLAATFLCGVCRIVLPFSAWSQPFGSLCLLLVLLFSPAVGYALLACCWLCSSRFFSSFVQIVDVLLPILAPLLLPSLLFISGSSGCDAGFTPSGLEDSLPLRFVGGLQHRCVLWAVSTFSVRVFIAASCHGVVLWFVQHRWAVSDSRFSFGLLALTENRCHFHTLLPFTCSDDFISLSCTRASPRFNFCGTVFLLDEPPLSADIRLF